MRSLWIIVFLALGLFGCDKYHAKKYAGVYQCAVHYHYFDITPTTYDSTYVEDVLVEQDGKELIVFNTRIHIDSLWKDREYTVGDIHNYLTIQFKDNKLFCTRHSGGLGGGSTYTYEGTKQ